MNELNAKIDHLKRLKHNYFLLNSTHSNEDYLKKFQEFVNQLVQVLINLIFIFLGNSNKYWFKSSAKLLFGQNL